MGRKSRTLRERNYAVRVPMAPGVVVDEMARRRAYFAAILAKGNPVTEKLEDKTDGRQPSQQEIC